MGEGNLLRLLLPTEFPLCRFIYFRYFSIASYRTSELVKSLTVTASKQSRNDDDDDDDGHHELCAKEIFRTKICFGWKNSEKPCQGR